MGFGDIEDSAFRAWADKVQAKVSNPAALKSELEQSLKRVGVQAMRRVSNATPVDTGNLRRGWNIDGPFIGGAVISLQLFNNVEYAPFIEFGHRTRGGGGWVPGHFMLRDTVESISNDLPALLTPGFIRAMEGLL